MSVTTTIQTALVKTSDVLGAAVIDPGGHTLAHVREVFLDPFSGQAHFAIVEIAALLGAGGKFHPVPWSLLQWDAGQSAYRVPFDKDRLKRAPSYDRDQINSSHYGWDAQTQAYYGA